MYRKEIVIQRIVICLFPENSLAYLYVVNQQTMKDFHIKRHITIRTEHNFHMLKVDEIIFMEAAALKTKVHLINHAIRIIELSIDDMEYRFREYPFWRSDNNHLINLKYLEKVSDKNDGTILLRGGFRVPIEENRKTILIEELTRL